MPASGRLTGVFSPVIITEQTCARLPRGSVFPEYSPGMAGRKEDAVKSPKKTTTLVLRIISGILTAVLFAAVCFVLVMAHPKPDKEKRGDPQPLLTASPALAVSSRADMEPLVRSFPVPVMTFLDTAGLTFDCASSEDAALPGGAGRIASIWWKTEDDEEVILQSIYPANAFSLLEGGYHFSNIGGPMLFGSQSVRMEKADTVRIHAAADTGLYVMIVPKSLASRIAALSRSLQLISYSD